MSTINLRLLGLAASRLETSRRRIFVDAYNTYQAPPTLAAGDLLLFTHNDHDHFCPHKTAQAVAEHANIVVGPPGIAYPLLAEAGLPASQLRIVYPPWPAEPLELALEEVKLSIWQTRHFVGWEPDHVSFLVEVGGVRAYFTGDSHHLPEQDPRLQELNALVYSLVEREIIDGKLDKDTATELHLRQLMEVQTRFRPRRLVANHLIACDWTADPALLRQAVKARGLKGIEVLEEPDQALPLR